MGGLQKEKGTDCGQVHSHQEDAVSLKISSGSSQRTLGAEIAGKKVCFKEGYKGQKFDVSEGVFQIENRL